MTKAEFDERFLSGELSVYHESIEEWNAITQYAMTLGAAKQPSDTYHNYQMFPYAFVDSLSHAMNARGSSCNTNYITFADFFLLVSGDDDELSKMDLSDIL